jgi:hypothetical protein
MKARKAGTPLRAFSNGGRLLILADLRSAPLALLERCMGCPAAKGHSWRDRASA